MADAFDPAMFAILVVDDEPANRDLLSRRLERKGYFVKTASSGVEALETIAQMRPDVVMLDINMPGMSGVEVLATVRKQWTFAEQPIIMCSAQTDSALIATCLTNGANDYVTKPLDMPVVLARLQSALSLKAAVDSLKAREYQLQAIADLSRDLIVLCKPDGTVRYASPSAREIVQVTGESLVGKGLFELVFPGDRATLPATPGDLQSGKVDTLRLLRGDGRTVWVELRAIVLRGNRTNKVTEIQASFRDISFFVDAATGAPTIPEPPVRRVSINPTGG
jgi:PAS domain S-box-containing protein